MWLISRLGQVESTHIRSSKNEDSVWDDSTSNDAQKRELESELEGRLLKLECESSFGSDYATADYLVDPYPTHLNPGFDLPVAIKVMINHWNITQFW